MPCPGISRIRRFELSELSRISYAPRSPFNSTGWRYLVKPKRISSSDGLTPESVYSGVRSVKLEVYTNVNLKYWYFYRYSLLYKSHVPLTKIFFLNKKLYIKISSGCIYFTADTETTNTTFSLKFCKRITCWCWIISDQYQPDAKFSSRYTSGRNNPTMEAITAPIISTVTVRKRRIFSPRENI